MYIAEINEFLETTPSGHYKRKVGFLFEFLIGKELVQEKEVGATRPICWSLSIILQLK
jgi:hypothetical protein